MSALPVGPGMVGFGQPVFDAMQKTDPVKGVSAKARSWPLAVLGQVSELDAVVGEHCVDAVRKGCNEHFEEGGIGPHSSLSTSSTTANFEVRSMATNQ